jgi:adenosylcobinamide kinase/adenosylcobinamide-phosphate guanylyltransferase
MLTLVLGGARSGKSRYAALLCGSEPVRYIATAQAAGDAEMSRRIERHRADRPEHWETLEAPIELAKAVGAGGVGANTVVLVDCITIWLSNLSFRHRALRPDVREKRILGEVSEFVAAATASPERTVIVVSNDVGNGIVPESAVAREFRDLQGLSNQAIAAASTRVILMVAGLPMIVKD